MTFSRALTDQQEEELIEDWHDDKWSINDLSVIYKVSHRTVYRTLAKHGVKKKDKITRKPRAARKPSNRELKPCGSEAAYRRHKRKGEYPCSLCLDAHAAEAAKYRKRNPTGRRRKRKERIDDRTAA